MKNTLILSLCLGACALAGCSSESNTEETLIIEHYKVPCVGVGPMLCMLVEEGDADPAYFYNSIEGFTYEWGHRYELAVQITEIADPPADGSSRRYELVEVISDTVVDERFTLALTADHVNGDPASGSFGLLDGPMVECAEATVCEAIAAAVTAGRQIRVELAHGAGQGASLIAHAAQETAPAL